jgi:uncharacterized protein (TIGR00730 family)
VTGLRSVCVFCGSSPGRPAYRQAAVETGRQLAGRGLRLVYGGASVGLMGTVADAVLAGGGQVLGVLPAHMDRVELAHPGLSELRIVASMHERKAAMAEAADAFLALPGGLGTLEELAEMATWAQLGLHAKPVALVNTAGYFDHLLALLDHAVAEGFVRPAHRRLLLEAEGPGDALDTLAAAARDLPPVRTGPGAPGRLG